MAERQTGFSSSRKASGIFKELHKRTADVAQELDAARIRAHGEGSGEHGVPRTKLEIRRKVRDRLIPGYPDGMPAGRGIPTAIIAARYRGRRINLLSLAEPADSGAAKTKAPAAISAYQGREMSGYYWLSRQASGLIVAKVGTLITPMSDPEDPLAGISELAEPRTPLKDLEPEDEARTRSAAEGILANLVAVERLSQGESIRRVFGSAGPPK
jgi:hypothetical protein